MDSVIVRDEAAADREAIRLVNEAAFGGQAEAMLVDALRANDRALLSLVAVADGSVIGHILFSPVEVVAAGGERFPAIALAPLAVVPSQQNRGVGSILTIEGLNRLRESGHGIVVVLGHTDYYPRFGFQPAAPLGIHCPWDVPEPAFMVAELVPGALEGVSGLVRYGPEFALV